MQRYGDVTRRDWTITLSPHWPEQLLPHGFECLVEKKIMSGGVFVDDTLQEMKQVGIGKRSDIEVFAVPKLKRSHCLHLANRTSRIRGVGDG